jgi:hypothetical protein
MTEKPAERKSPERSQEQRIADLEAALAQSRANTPLGTIPDHGAGPGQEIAETWSQAEQEDAQAGNIDEEGPPVEPAPGQHKR